MRKMTDLAVWPSDLPSSLRELPAQVAAILDMSPHTMSDLHELVGLDGPALIVLTGAIARDASVFTELDKIIDSRTSPTALVIGDGWIGTDGPDIASAIVGAGTVALARSIAVRRRTTGRVNVVSIPERLVTEAGSQRGPLALEISTGDVAEVVAFVLSDKSSYIDGQVLYANGGRQLFSSLTA
jgi:hypothetical protein